MKDHCKDLARRNITEMTEINPLPNWQRNTAMTKAAPYPDKILNDYGP